jgi:hypothetical protein
VVLMQVCEHNRSQIGSWRPGGCEPVTELADQRLDARSVAQETRSKAACSSRSGTPAAGVKNAASGGSHGGVIWPSLITAQLRRPAGIR